MDPKINMRCLLLFFVLLTSFSLEAQTGVNFSEITWEEAQIQSKQEGKLIFVFGYVTWSEPCAVMDEYTFGDAEVGSYFKNQFINIRMDMEDFPGVSIAEDLGITAFPALLFVNDQGEVVHRGCGALDADELLSLGEKAKGENNLSELLKRYNQGEKSLDLIKLLSENLESACMDREWIAERYFDQTDRNLWMDETSWVMLNLNVSDPYSEPFQYLMSYHDMFALKYGKDTVDAKIYNVLIDQLIGIYEGEDLTYFATQSLRHLMRQIDFNDKSELVSLVELKKADLKNDWKNFAIYASKVVVEQQVTDPDQLNEFAWKFYLHVPEKEHLENARKWMEQVLDQYPYATFYDTYASLSFKIGDQKEAIKYGKKALQAAEVQGEDLFHYKNQLELFQLRK